MPSRADPQVLSIAQGFDVAMHYGHDLVGMVIQAEVARSLSDPRVGELLQALSTD